jgi:hypothetical protein
MKIDFAMLDRLVAAGAPASAIVELLKFEDEKRAPKKSKERDRQRAKRSNTKQQSATSSNNEQHPPTSTETPSQTAERELFKRGKELCGPRAGGMITALIRSKDYDLKAAREVVDTAATKSDPREFIAAAIGRPKNGAGNSVMAAADRLIARAKELELSAGFGSEPDEALPGFGARP